MIGGAKLYSNSRAAEKFRQQNWRLSILNWIAPLRIQPRSFRMNPWAICLQVLHWHRHFFTLFPPAILLRRSEGFTGGTWVVICILIPGIGGKSRDIAWWEPQFSHWFSSIYRDSFHFPLNVFLHHCFSIISAILIVTSAHINYDFPFLCFPFLFCWLRWDRCGHHTTIPISSWRWTWRWRCWRQWRRW